jgi:tetratricopeptide (TPR) repeat protein
VKLVSPLLLGAAVSLAGCAYYNGLYNANRLVDDAVRAEREGRPSEARSLWAQAAIKAESVAVRFPESKHRDDALLVQGRALTAIGQCVQAVSPLRVAADTSPDPDLRARARLLLAACWVELGAADSVIDILTPEIASPDPLRRNEARRLRGRALLLRGEYERAIDDLTGLETSRSDRDLAMAYIGLGAIDGAAALLARHIGDPFDEAAWRAVLDSLSQRQREAAADLVDQLAATGSLTPGQEARLLLDDGERWLAAGEDEIALRRFRAAGRAAPDSLDGRIAAGRAAVVTVRRGGDVQKVPELAEALLAAVAGGAGGEVVLFAEILRRVASLVGSGTTRPADADMRLFLLAEAVRDSLEAPALAGALFRFVPQAFPASPVAAKGLLAAAALDPAAADSLVELVFRTYPTSPYARVLRGEALAEFAAVEDSLRMVARGEAVSDGERPRPLVRAGWDERPKDEVIRHGRRPGKP